MLSDITRRQDAELRAALAKIHWPIDYGTISVQIRGGKPKLIRIERTIEGDP